MKFPKKQIDDLQTNLREWHSVQYHDTPEQYVSTDPKDLEDVILYSEMSNARIQELEQQNSALMFKLRCVAQALK